MKFILLETCANGCYYCGHGETCKTGAVLAKHGDGFKITNENTPCVSKDAVCMENARQAGRHLGKILKTGHDRDKATREVKEALIALRTRKTSDEAL